MGGLKRHMKFYNNNQEAAAEAHDMGLFSFNFSGKQCQSQSGLKNQIKARHV